jgi:hypothetical protein
MNSPTSLQTPFHIVGPGSPLGVTKGGVLSANRATAVLIALCCAACSNGREDGVVGRGDWGPRVEAINASRCSAGFLSKTARREGATHWRLRIIYAEPKLDGLNGPELQGAVVAGSRAISD